MADDRIERAKDAALGKHDDHPSIGDQVGEAAGGISGVLTGAAIGSAGGPVGTLIGGIAGALGGWWSGRAIAEAAAKLTDADDTHYRTHYEGSAGRPANRTYDDVRPAYHLGHVASLNPDYSGRSWDDVEPEIRRGWSTDVSTKHGEWDSVRGYASEGYTRGRTSGSSGPGLGQRAANAAGSLGDKVVNAADRVADKVSGSGESGGSWTRNEDKDNIRGQADQSEARLNKDIDRIP